MTDTFVPGPVHREIDEGKVPPGKTAQSRDEGHYAEEEDGPWYPGRAREEFNRRRRGKNVEPVSQEEDPVQVCPDLIFHPATLTILLSGHESVGRPKTIAMATLVLKTISKVL